MTNTCLRILLFFAIALLGRTALAQSSQTVCAGSSTAPVSFTSSPYFPYTWVNDNPAIGLPASGTGHIASFVAQNATQTTQVASVTVQSYTSGYALGGGSTVNPITISAVGNGSSTAAPYPSTLVVSEFTLPSVSGISVILRGFSHPSPQDVDILLVAPTGQRAIIMSDVGGNMPVSNLNLRIGSEGFNSMSATGPLMNFNELNPDLRTLYMPTNINDPSDSPDIFPAPAPTVSSTVASMSPFFGIDPTGIWSLYVVDDQGNNVGTIAGGWQLSFIYIYDPNLMPYKQDIFTYTVNPTPAVSLSHNAPQTCAVQLTATPGGSQYTFSGGAIPQGNNTALVSEAGVYSVTLTDANGCSNTATTTVMDGQVVAPTLLLAQALPVTVSGALGAGNCSVRVTGQGHGNSFVFTGPGGYVFSNVYRRGGTYPVVAEAIKQPGVYTFTAYYQNECGQQTSDSRTFVVTGTACQ